MTFNNHGLYIQRQLKAPLDKQVSFFLFGPRGCGKSTWIAQMVKNALIIDLLHTESYRLLLANPSRLENMIASQHDNWVVIDEIQKVPELLNEVHRLIASHKTRFILTGSSARKLRKEAHNLLAGRARRYYMHPLTSTELAETFDLEKALTVGLLPEAYTSHDPIQFLDSYLNTYLREEVLQEGLSRNLSAFSSFLEAASFSQGAVLNVSEVARDCGLGRVTVENYFSLLEDLLIAVRIPVFTKRSKRKLISQKKFYFFDCGVYRHIRPKGILDSVSEIGGITLETLIFQQIRAQNDYLEKGYQIFYWRTKHGVEVDFILYGPNGFMAIEVKLSKNLSSKDFNGLRHFKEDYPEVRLYLIYGGNRKEKHGDILVLPIRDFLNELPGLL